MKAPRIFLIAATSWAIFAAPAAPAQDTGSATFAEKCTACHTIGSGNAVGPDLSKVSNWTDADLSVSVRRMEKMVGPLTDEQVNGLVSFLKRSDATSQLQAKQAEAKAKASIEQDKNPASANNGRLLYFGKQPFENGGMSCVSCHSAGAAGGALGPDLSTIGQRMSETALVSACENTSFKVMKKAYANHQITHQEARDLAKYFQATKPVESRVKIDPTWLAGTAIATVALAAIGFGFRKRNSQVRDKLRRR